MEGGRGGREVGREGLREGWRCRGGKGMEEGMEGGREREGGSEGGREMEGRREEGSV